MADMEYESIEVDGDTWRVLGVGAALNGGRSVRLASMTRVRHQRNG